MSTSGLHIRDLAGFDDPACSPDVWNRLVPRGHTDVVYLTWEYQRSWWEAFGYGDLLLLAAERDGEVVAIAPFYVDEGVVWFVGSGAADYLVKGEIGPAELERSIRYALDRLETLKALRESGGGAVTVSDSQIMEYMKVVASLEGIFVCPEGAATAAALGTLLADGAVSPNDRILLLNTGSGLKNLELL